MSSTIEPTFFAYVILAFGTLAAVTDVLRGRIYNWITVPAIASGIAASAWFLGASGALSSFLAALLGLALYGWIFWMGAMGGGDVKFLMAIGAWGGSHYVIEVAILGVVLGGLMAIGSLVAKGKIKAFFRKLYRFILTSVVRELEVETPQIDHSMTLPFGLPIAIAAAWVAYGDPFARLGVSLWAR